MWLYGLIAVGSMLIGYLAGRRDERNVWRGNGWGRR